MNWELGRKKSGYWKLKIVSKFFFDAYLLKYPVGSRIDSHIDPVLGKRHYRMNFELKKPKHGGILKIENPILQFWRIAIFRSDQSLHSVSEIKTGERWVLSFGVAI